MSRPRMVGPWGMTAFVPNGDSRRETAIILIGAAREYGLDDSRAVAATQGGFYISDELVDLLYDEQDQQDGAEVSGNEEPEPEPTKKASGNRAAKKNSKE